MNPLPPLEPLDTLVAAFSRLPGIGRRTAERLALAVVQDGGGLARLLADALLRADEQLASCERCGALTLAERNPCPLCTRPRRDAHILCVVETPADILKIEQTGVFRGRYHALMGRLSPVHGIGPDDLRIEPLLRRLGEESITEVLLALGSDVESDATAAYLRELLAPRGVRLTRLAFGLPAGAPLEYADPATLARAVAGRAPLDPEPGEDSVPRGDGE